MSSTFEVTQAELEHAAVRNHVRGPLGQVRLVLQLHPAVFLRQLEKTRRGLVVGSALAVLLVGFFAAPALAGLLGLSGTAATVSTLALTMGLSTATQGLLGSTAAAANWASNVISTISVGQIGDCIQWGFGTASAWACKGVLWQIGGSYSKTDK